MMDKSKHPSILVCDVCDRDVLDGRGAQHDNLKIRCASIECPHIVT